MMPAQVPTLHLWLTTSVLADTSLKRHRKKYMPPAAVLMQDGCSNPELLSLTFPIPPGQQTMRIIVPLTDIPLLLLHGSRIPLPLPAAITSRMTMSLTLKLTER